MKNKYRTLIAVFFLLLAGPVTVFPLVRGFIDTENHENRKLAEFSDVINAPIKKMPLYFQEYFSDHLPFKNQLMTLNSLVSITLFNTTADPRVMVGRDNWLFFNNIGLDNPIDDVTGISVFTGDELAQIAASARRQQSVLEAKGIDFYLMIAPNKENIYAEYLPDYVLERVAEKSRVDILAEYLMGADINFVYPKDDILAAKNEGYQLYYKYDTHWNGLGAYLAAKDLFDLIGLPAAELGETDISQSYPAPVDLADSAAIAAFCRDDAMYAPAGFGAGVAFEQEDVSPGITRFTSSAADRRTMVVVGDSYSDALAPYLYLTFGEVIVINRNRTAYSLEEIIKTYSPDITVLEMVERAGESLLHNELLNP